MEKKIIENFRLNSLRLKNIRRFDSFEIDFPLPTMKGDPDIYVIGSSNGVGKTTILEACAMVYYLTLMYFYFHNIHRYFDILKPIFNNFIRIGEDHGEIRGNFFTYEHETLTDVILHANGNIVPHGNDIVFNSYREEIWEKFGSDINAVINPLLGVSSNPLILPSMLYFHSYRKVKEGSIQTGRLVGNRDGLKSGSANGQEESMRTPSLFKMLILQLLLAKSGQIENIAEIEAEQAFAKLNELLIGFADGNIDKMKLLSDNTLELKVKLSYVNGSISFDSLSSGQKEIISTLFLIWYHSLNTPSIVLIDEPELHLNAGWHKDFIQQLDKLAPNNQYIIATHSEEIFDSVDAERRVMLTWED